MEEIADPLGETLPLLAAFGFVVPLTGPTLGAARVPVADLTSGVDALAPAPALDPIARPIAMNPLFCE
ncbi:UNVERIFIED_CONTAM: hypothetical protein Slati_2436200 [Sesamum latifolium]|uniref:Uncharacterized protein n=1 Tax=Sesamum latifolium TaxID=2727402 RepID=A0AAW2WGK0_9LAMI